MPETPDPGVASTQSTRLGAWVAAALALPLTVICALAWRLSLSWPTIHDLPIMLYLSFLWDRFDRLPHAGFFDMNLLGSYLSYLAIGRIFGYEATGVRAADLCLFVVLVVATLLVLRRVGWLVGWVAAALFGMVYLQLGPIMSLQREYLMLVPVAAAVAVAGSIEPSRWRLATAASGVLVGIAATVKPQAVVAAVPILAFAALEAGRGLDASERSRSRALIAAACWLGSGILVVALLLLLALVWLGVLREFWEIASGYLPLYGAMTGRHEILPADERTAYLLRQMARLGRHWDWVLAAAVGGGSAWLALPPGDPRRRHLLLVVGMAVSFAVYPLFGGKFWPYHWLPMLYWCVVSASLALVGLFAGRRAALGWAATAAFALFVLYAFPPADDFGHVLTERSYRPGTGEQIADFLGPRLLPGDTVQPMDWTKGAVLHGLLLARAEAATSFVYDFHFHHHVSHPYIRNLRSRFLRELRSASPRFIVRSNAGPYPSGEDTSRRFPQFRAFLDRNYHGVVKTRAYSILERNPSPPTQRGG